MRFFRPAILIAVFWALSATWLVRYEAFPHWFSDNRLAYRDVFSGGLLVMDAWMRILWQDQPVGWAHTWVDSEDSQGRRLFQLRNQAVLALNLSGLPVNINVNLNASLDDNYRLNAFVASLRANELRIRIDARRIAPDRFELIAGMPDGERKMEVTLPDDAMLYMPMTEILSAGLSPGRTASMRIFNPVNMAVENMRITAVRRETISVDGQDYSVVLLKTLYQGFEMSSWVDAQGRTIRQTTPFGFTMEICSAGEARLPDTAPAIDGLTGIMNLFGSTGK